MKLLLLFVAPVSVSLLGGAPGIPDEVKLEPREGRALVKSFRVENEFSTESSSARGSGHTSSSTSSTTLVVTDTVNAVADGRATEFVRVYDEVAAESESTMQFGDTSRDSSSEGSSDVEGSTVTFEWDADDQEYVARSDDVDDEVLDELPRELDFTELLPEDEVSEDDEWEVEVEAFERLRSPWDGLPWETEYSDGRVRSSDEDAGESETDESTDGEITARYEGTRDEDGITVAVIRLEGEIEVESSRTSTRDNAQGTSTMEMETTETHVVEGTLLWNVEGGHLHVLELEIDVTASSSVHSVFTFDDREFENDSEVERTGVVAYTVSMSAAD